MARSGTAGIPNQWVLIPLRNGLGIYAAGLARAYDWWFAELSQERLRIRDT
jgi:hypothetical protein